MNIIDFPEHILVSILKFLDLSHLLQSVNRTCKRLHNIIEENSILWRFFEFETIIIVGTIELKRILKHSAAFRRLFLPYSTRSFDAPLLDLMFVTAFAKSRHLYWLDISDSPISTLCFLRCTSGLSVLNLSGCKNLTDCDFHVISNCKELDHLYLSFTNITQRKFVEIASKLNLISLDGCGIKLSIPQCIEILQGDCRHLDYFQLSLSEETNTTVFRREVEEVFSDCKFNIYRP